MTFAIKHLISPTAPVLSLISRAIPVPYYRSAIRWLRRHHLDLMMGEEGRAGDQEKEIEVVTAVSGQRGELSFACLFALHLAK